MPNLSLALGGPRLFVKRDDCTGLATGGNKARQLEYYFGQASVSDADTILITGAVQSNFVRQAAAAARKCRMECHIQLEKRLSRSDATYLRSGNVLLNHLLGAEIHHFDKGHDESAADLNLDVLAESLRAKGRKPYVIHLGVDHTPWGGLGYVDAGRETATQVDAMGLTIDAVVLASGSGLTHAGFLTGWRAAGKASPIYGICVRRDANEQKRRIERRLAEIIALAGLSPSLAGPNDINVDDSWLGPGYGRLTQDIRNAIDITAQHEGLILDPVYTGKTMAGLICMVRNSVPANAKNILFLHTGGSVALFGYEELTMSEKGNSQPETNKVSSSI
tara:strand:- start:626 stop:1627 length:1002 start_codon:yes stop_codon:yes gene_type:complete